MALAKMADDYIYRMKLDFPDKYFHISDDINQQHLLDLENIVQSCTPTKSLVDFKLPISSSASLDVLYNRLLLEEITYDIESLKRQILEMVSQLMWSIWLFTRLLSCQRN